MRLCRGNFKLHSYTRTIAVISLHIAATLFDVCKSLFIGPRYNSINSCGRRNDFIDIFLPTFPRRYVANGAESTYNRVPITPRIYPACDFLSRCMSISLRRLLIRYYVPTRIIPAYTGITGESGIFFPPIPPEDGRPRCTVYVGETLGRPRRPAESRC